MVSCLDPDEGLICSSAEYLNILRTIVNHVGPQTQGTNYAGALIPIVKQ